MALYEHTFLARQDISSQQAEALVEHFSKVLTENGGTISKVENWGLRNSAYRIAKNRKAHYLHLNVDAPAPALAEMERQMRIHEDILRYLTIRVEELEDGPSAMMKKSDRDDRRPRHNDRDSRPPREDRKPAAAPAAPAPVADASETKAESE
ncbi:MAG: 30S ribosomal protein S6 [Rhizobiaceae bacterium]|nr:30S ribosomal protein S6 [Rhizobiaceae bacterium]